MSNNRAGSIYMVQLVESALFSRGGDVRPGEEHHKDGAAAWERRTGRREHVNLRECFRACSERVFFVNTGFLNRVGDEIHTCRHAESVAPKLEMRKVSWLADRLACALEATSETRQHEGDVRGQDSVAPGGSHCSLGTFPVAANTTTAATSRQTHLALDRVSRSNISSSHRCRRRACQRMPECWGSERVRRASLVT